MAKVVCKKCGSTGISKCPIHRNVFPDNQADAVMSQIFKYEIIGDGHGTAWIQVSFMLGSIDHEYTDEFALKQLDKRLHDMVTQESDNTYPPRLAVFLCDHDWVLADGEHCDIGCGNH